MTTEYAGFYKNFVVDTNGGGDVNDMPYVGVVASSTGDVIFIKEPDRPDDENGNGIKRGTSIDSITRADAYCDALNCTAVNATGNITTTNGSVGIGTTTPDPAYKLDVNGDIRATGRCHILQDYEILPDANDTTHLRPQLRVGNSTITGNGASAYFGYSGRGNSDIINAATYWRTIGGLYGTTGYFGIAVNNKSASDAGYGITEGELVSQTHLAITDTGNVGIGTTTPDSAYKLDVNGNIKASGNITADGRVGIATTTDPAYKLDVRAGDFEGINVSSTLTPNRGIQLLKGNGDDASTTEINGVLQSWLGIGFRCSYDSTIRHTFNTRNGDAYFAGSLGLGKDYDPGYKLDVAGNIKASGNITANAVIAASGETGGIYLNGDTTNTWERIWYGEQKMRYGGAARDHVFTGSIEATGSVGIGTVPSSSYKLDVAGSIRASGSFESGNQILSEGDIRTLGSVFSEGSVFVGGDILTLGQVGIGSSGFSPNTFFTPLAKLHVVGFAGALNDVDSRYFSYEEEELLVQQSNASFGGVSIFASNDIVTQQYLVATTGSITSSDERIKENIEDISDTEALDKLRLLKPKTYTYKDTVERGTESVIGFIAQEVREVIPTAVSVRTDVIPNIYELATVSQSNVITFTNFNTSNLQADSNMISIRTVTGAEERVTLANTIDEHTIQVVEDLTGLTGSVDENGNVVTETITQEEYDALESKYGIVPKYTPDITKEEYDALTDEEKSAYTVEYSKPVGNQIFVYGQEVDDFNFLKKESIFTVATAALQEVDRQQQADKQRIATLENLVQTLIEEVAALKAGTAS